MNHYQYTILLRHGEAGNKKILFAHELPANTSDFDVFTGKFDVADNQIFTNDIVRFDFDDAREYSKESKFFGIVVFSEKNAAFGLISIADYIAGVSLDKAFLEFFNYNSPFVPYSVIGNLREQQSWSPEIMEWVALQNAEKEERGFEP